MDTSNTMPEHSKRNTFTSYVAHVDNEWCLPNDLGDVYLAIPKLLHNELIVASAPAYMYPGITPIDSDLETPKEAVFGLLTVTNFKLAFVPLQCQTKSLNWQESYQEHAYLQRNDVTLNNIDHIYQIPEAGRSSALSVGSRRKKLEAQQKAMNGRIAALHIVCKNFRLLKFAFITSKTGTDSGKLITSALARFAFRSRHDLSFGYAFNEPYYSTLGKGSTIMFCSKNDWARELIRCGATQWQVVSAANVPALQHKLQAAKYNLPHNFVIPKHCSVEHFLDLSRAFCDGRAAFWVYSYGQAALVRLAELKPSLQQDTKLENGLLESVRKCNSKRLLELLQLTDRLPSVQDVQRAYLKFRRLCTPEGPQQFLLHDVKFLTLLEKTNWLFYVSLCLRTSCEAAEFMRKDITCVLQDANGRDLCCIVSSLTQIILDPHYRSIDGFQSLVQKEWVALEHKFQTRLGHVKKQVYEENETGESPVFLLFLDCVWQLLKQYPDEFEFTQTYLTTLWDACFLPLFDTFQFDTETERQAAVREHKLVLRPVWDWSEQFAEKDKVFFTNPLYQRQRQDYIGTSVRRSMAIPAGGVMLPGLSSNRNTLSMNPQLFATQSAIPKDRYLEPQHRMSELDIWEQCYYRWMPVLEIKYGGQPQVDLYHRLLLSNIAKLQRALDLQDFEDLPDVYYEITGDTRPPQIESVPAACFAAAGVEAASTAAAKRKSMEFVDGVERRVKPVRQYLPNELHSSSVNTAQLFAISSFFPFSVNQGESTQLIDILSSSNEYLLEGSSIMERLSIV